MEPGGGWWWKCMQTPNSLVSTCIQGCHIPRLPHSPPHVYSTPFPHPGLLPYKTRGEKCPSLSNTLFQLSSSRGDLKRQNPPPVFPPPHVPLCPLWLLRCPPRPSEAAPAPSPVLRRHQPEPPPCKVLRQMPITLGPLTVPILL